MHSQTAPSEYYRGVREADSLYKAKSYLASGKSYFRAFRSFGKRGFTNDRYNAACSWALANFPDSAFAELHHISRYGFDDYQKLTSDTDLLGLHKDSRWKNLTQTVKRNSVGSKVKLRTQIDAMCQQDQKWLNLLIRFWNGAIPADSITETLLKSKIDSIHNAHYYQLAKIVSKHDFPNYDDVGFVGSQNFWVLVQHQDNYPEFQEKVLLLMEKEVKLGKASASNFAYLTDRVKINTNQLQVYGTQMRLNEDSTSYEPSPVIDPLRLNERRASVGMAPIEDYINQMNKIHSGKIKKRGD